MVQFATLDAERLKKADAYLPIARKAAIIRILAPGCIEEVEGDQTVPPRWQESPLGKRLVLTYALAGVYLHLTDVQGLYSESPTFDFSARQYDTFSQLFTQLESIKRDRDADPEDKAKAASILTDYKDFEKMLNAEIYNLLQAKNDLLPRVVSMFLSYATPEAVQEAAEALQAAQKEAEEAAKAHKEFLESFDKGA